MAARLIFVSVGRRTGGGPGGVRSHVGDYLEEMRESIKEVTDNLLAVLQGFIDESPKVMLEAMKPTFLISQRLCPIKTGKLRASGYLEITGFRGNARVEIGYAKGGNPWYAPIVHENLEAFHEPPTQAKFLEDAINQDEQNILARIAEGYEKRVLRGRGLKGRGRGVRIT